MKESFELTIISPTGILYRAYAVSLIVPAAFGYLGILAHHAPLIAQLKEGKITITEPQGKDVIFDVLQRGFLEVSDNKATIIFDAPACAV